MPKKKIVDRASYEIMIELKKQFKVIKDPDAKKAARDAVARLKLFAYDETRQAVVEEEVKKIEDTSKKISQQKELTYYKKYIFDCAIRGFTAGEICAKIKDIGGKNYSKALMRKFLRENIESDPKFQEFRKKYQEGVEDVRLYHKRSRLDILQELYNKEKWKYDSAPTTTALNNVMKILEQARKEAEYQNHQINIFNQNNFIQNIIAGEEMKRALGQLPLQEIILGRVAARSRIHPSILINRLNSSIYSKFNGSEHTDSDSLKSEPIYPAKMLMDMSEIKSKNVKFTDALKKKEEVIEDAETNISHQKDIKEELRKKLEKIKKDLAKKQDR